MPGLNSGTEVMLHWGKQSQMPLVWRQFDALNTTQLEAEDAITATMKDAPWRFGIEHDVDWTMQNSGRGQ